MQSNLENLSALERRLDLTVSRQKIKEAVETRLKNLSKTIKIHGFRPGKVPLKVVAQQYGAQFEQDALKDALKKNLNEVVQEEKLRVAGFPHFEGKPAKDDSGEFEFSATFEIYPEVILGDLSKVEVDQPTVKVTSSDLDKTLEILRKQRTKYEAVERAVAEGDRVNVDYSGTVNEVAFEGGSATNVNLVLGEGKFLKDFEESIVGMSKGEKKSFEVNFPEDYHGKEIAGKAVIFEVQLNKVEKAILPEIDADFVKSLGIADGDKQKMYDGVRQQLEMEVSRQKRLRLKEQVMQSLLDTTAFEAPKVLINQEINQLMQNARKDFEERGLKAEDTVLSPDMFHGKAEHRIKLGLILAELVSKNNLKAKPEQVRRLIEDSAQGYENPDEVVKWHYSSPERVKDYESVVLEDNAVTWVLQQVTVVDKVVTFDELMGTS